MQPSGQTAMVPHRSFFGALQADLLLCIFQHLQIRELLAAARVCHNFRGSALHHIARTEVLALHQTGATSLAASHVAWLVRRLPRLRKLSVAYTKLDFADNGEKDLGDALSATGALMELCLEGSSLVGIHEPGLLLPPSLSRLCLSSTQIACQGPPWLEGLLIACERCPNLVEIDLTGLVGGTGARLETSCSEMLEALARRCPQLGALGIGFSAVSGVLPPIRFGAAMQHLDLSMVMQYRDSSALFVSLAAECPNLRSLAVEGLHVSDQGLERLTGGCRHLAALHLVGCSGWSRASFVTGLRQAENLTDLNLDRAAVTYEMLAELLGSKRDPRQGHGEDEEESGGVDGANSADVGQVPYWGQRLRSLSLPSAPSETAVGVDGDYLNAGDSLTAALTHSSEELLQNFCDISNMERLAVAAAVTVDRCLIRGLLASAVRLRQLFLGYGECSRGLRAATFSSEHDEDRLSSFLTAAELGDLLPVLPPTLEALSFAERDCGVKEITSQVEWGDFTGACGDVRSVSRADLEDSGCFDEAGRFWSASACLFAFAFRSRDSAFCSVSRSPLPNLRRVGILRLPVHPGAYTPRRTYLWEPLANFLDSTSVGNGAEPPASTQCHVVVSALRRGRFGAVFHSALDSCFRKNTLFPLEVRRGVQANVE